MFHLLRETARRGKQFQSCERASVALTVVIALPVLLGAAGLAIEYADALAVRAETQRTADLAVHAAALAYGQTGSTEAMTAEARNIAILNGLGPETTDVQLDSTGVLGPVVRLRITTPRSLVLSRMIDTRQTLDVTVRSAALIEQQQQACIQALDPGGPGVTVSGGVSITTSTCAVASNSEVSATGGSSIVTETLTYDSASFPTITEGASVTAPDGGATRIVRASTTDLIADREAIGFAKARLAAVNSLAAPEMSAVAPGPNIDFGWNDSVTRQQAIAVGCVAARTGEEVARLIAGLVAGDERTALVNLNNAITADLQAGGAVVVSGGSGIERCYCPSSDSAAQFSWGGSVECGMSCGGGGTSGRFVTINAQVPYHPLLGIGGFFTDGQVRDVAVVRLP